MTENTDHDVTDTDDTASEFDPDDLYRTRAAATFMGHLFTGADVRAAGVENGGEADHPVPPLCSRRTDRGPFEPIDADDIMALADRDIDPEDRDLCGTCVDTAAARIAKVAPDPDGTPVNPGEFTVDELGDWLDDPDEGGLLDDDELAALRAAERDGKNRTTALREIDRRRET